MSMSLCTQYSVSGVGVSMGYIAAYSAANRQCSNQYVGTISVALSSAINLSPILLTTVYNIWFLRDGTYQNQDIRGYMLFVSASLGIVHLFGCVVFLIPLQDSENITDTDRLLDNKSGSYLTIDDTVQELSTLHGPEEIAKIYENHDHQNSADCETSAAQITLHDPEEIVKVYENKDHQNRVDSEKPAAHVNGVPPNDCGNSELRPPGIMDIFKSPLFHLTVWTASILLSLKYIVINNISTITRSLSLNSYETILPYIPHVTSIICKPLLGFVSDSTEKYVPRIWYLITASVMVALVFVVAIFALDRIWVFIPALIVWPIFADAGYLQYAIYTRVFGKKYFNINTGISATMLALAMFMEELCFNGNYKLHVSDDGVCYGLKCFTGEFELGIVLCMLCLASFVAYVFVCKRQM